MNNYATFKDLEDTSVFITGGGSGIGAAIDSASRGHKTLLIEKKPSPVLIESKSEHFVIPHELSLIDLSISQHSSPGSLEVVIGVENVPGGVDSVPGRNLMVNMCPVTVYIYS